MAGKLALTALIVAAPFLFHMFIVSAKEPERFRSSEYWFPPLVVTVCFFFLLGCLIAWVWE